MQSQRRSREKRHVDRSRARCYDSPMSNSQLRGEFAKSYERFLKQYALMNSGSTNLVVDLGDGENVMATCSNRVAGDAYDERLSQIELI